MSSFDLKQAALMAASGVFFAWLGGPTAPPHEARPANRRDPAPSSRPRLAERSAADPIVIEPLHDWRHLAQRPTLVRNVFAFQARTRQPAVIQRRVAEIPVLDAPTAPPAPSLKLVGVAEDYSATGATRTAIISGEGQLFMVSDGEAVTPRYRVTAVTSNSVDLEDLVTNTSLRLLLK